MSSGLSSGVSREVRCDVSFVDRAFVIIPDFIPLFLMSCKEIKKVTICDFDK